MGEGSRIDMLTREFQQGSEIAFEQLVAHYRAGLGNFLLRYVRDPWAVEDLIQETFMKALKYRDRYDGRASFKTWLYMIALSVYRDSRRARKDPVDAARGREIRDRDHPEDRRARPDHAVQHQELSRRVEQLVHSLPEDQREIFLLYRYERMTTEEIARVVGRPAGTVKSSMHLALKKIRAGLEAIGYEM